MTTILKTDEKDLKFAFPVSSHNEAVDINTISEIKLDNN